MRLDKLVSHLGYGSRKLAKQYIRKGYVSVNGVIIKDDDFHVNEVEDEIVFLDEKVEYHEFQYFILNKPKESICSQDRSLYPSVLDLIQENVLPNTQPVGRLDVDTTGVILITNDGQLAHRLLSPKHHVEKVYEVTLKYPFEEKWISEIEKGLTLNQDEVCLPAKVTKVDDTHLLLVLKEGKYHQVKRMMLSCENEVIDLNRKSFASLEVNDLNLGEYRRLSEDEIKMLKDM